jgi:hypothetical protein
MGTSGQNPLESGKERRSSFLYVEYQKCSSGNRQMKQQHVNMCEEVWRVKNKKCDANGEKTLKGVTDEILVG